MKPASFISFLIPAAALLLLSGACGPDGEKQALQERRITLLDLKGSRAGRIVPGGRPVIKAARTIANDPRSCFILKPGEAALFHRIPVHPKARLAFLLGASEAGKVSVDVRVTLAESGKAASGPGSTCEVAAGEPGWFPLARELSAFEGQRIDVCFFARPGTGLGELLVGSPVITSDGKPVSLNDVLPITIEEVVLDFIERFDTAEMIRSDPEKPLRIFPFNLDREKRTEADEAKKCVRAAPGSEFRFTVDVPEGAFLEVKALNYPAADFSAKDPGTVEFAVAVNGETLCTLRSDFLNVDSPDVLIYDRITEPARIDLGPFAGQRVVLTFSTRCLEGDAPAGFEYGWWDLFLKRTLRVSWRRATKDRPNVLFLCVDALRADHLGCYGYDRPTSKHLDALSTRSLLFERAVSQSSWTMPATASLLTGLYPNTHGVLGDTRSYLLNAITTLPEYLAAHGVTTAAFSANHLIADATNYSQGLELFDEIHECAEGIHDDLFAWLESQAPFQFFAYVHYMEPHSPYSAPGKHRQHFDPDYVEKRDFSGALPERFRSGQVEKAFTPGEIRHLINLYDAEIRYWDLQFKRLLERLDALSLADRTVIIVTADHGEEFFDHDGLGHGLTLYNEVLHVPLILHDPRMRKGGRVRDYVDTAALFDTVTDLMGFETPAFTQVKSLLPVGRIPERFRTLFSATDSNMLGVKERLASIIEPPLKLILNIRGESVELYHLDEDPSEQRNLKDLEPEQASMLEERVRAWYRTTAEAFPGGWQPDTEEIRKRFEALGYVDPGS